MYTAFMISEVKYSHQKEKVHVSLQISVLGLIPAALYSTLCN